jgi:hypothetical protein
MDIFWLNSYSDMLSSLLFPGTTTSLERSSTQDPNIRPLDELFRDQFLQSVHGLRIWFLLVGPDSDVGTIQAVYTHTCSQNHNQTGIDPWDNLPIFG